MKKNNNENNMNNRNNVNYEKVSKREQTENLYKYPINEELENIIKNHKFNKFCKMSYVVIAGISSIHIYLYIGELLLFSNSNTKWLFLALGYLILGCMMPALRHRNQERIIRQYYNNKNNK
jgi:cytosine/uracil/thiamine/allantoin permease